MQNRWVLIRHAEAVSERSDLSDESRYLTESGRAKAFALGKQLQELGLSSPTVMASPLVRAVQTAELVRAGAGWTGIVEISEGLVPEASVGEAEDWLRQLAGDVVLVGHEPMMSGFLVTLKKSGPFQAFGKPEAAVVGAEDRHELRRFRV